MKNRGSSIARSDANQEFKAHGLAQLREAIAVLEQKVTPQEVDDYRRFVLTLSLIHI